MHKTVNILDWNIWFGSFRELKCIYCNCSNDLPSRASSFFASMINYSSREFNHCLKLHYTQAPHKAMQDIPFSVELYFCATVSLQLEHVLGRGTFGLRQYRLAAAFSCGRWHHCQWTVFLRTLQFFLGPNILHEWQIVYWSVSVQTNHFFRKSSADIWCLVIQLFWF